MNKRGSSRANHSRGFTLVESIIVIVVLAIAATGIAALVGNIFSGQTSVKDLQVRTRIMEECAEQVLAVRRFDQDGYDAVNSTRFWTGLCGGVPAQAGYNIPTVSFQDPYTGPSSSCPTGTCKLVFISHEGMTSLTLLLVDY